MKKKHLHGKLSLKMKDLSAMNAQARIEADGGQQSVNCFTKAQSNCAECTDVPTMFICTQTCADMHSCLVQTGCLSANPADCGIATQQTCAGMQTCTGGHSCLVQTGC